MSDARRLFGYARVSSDGQVEGTSLSDQAARLRAWASAQGLSMAEVVEDVASGATLERPGLDRLRTLLRAGDEVVVLKLDRLSRSIVDAEPLVSEWESQGIAVHSATEPLETSTAMGRAMFRMVIVFAQAEREVIAERVAAGKVRNAERGCFNGSPIPYGYRAGAEPREPFVVEPAEAGVVRELFRRYGTGRYGPARLRAMTGCELSEDGTVELLANPVYTGRLKWGSVARPAGHEPIVSDRQFMKVQRERARRARSPHFRGWKLRGTTKEMVISCGQR